MAEAPGTHPQALAASGRRDLSGARRWERPVPAAIAREVSVATEMTSDLGRLWGGGLGGRCRRCYGNHVAGSRGAGASRGAGRAGFLSRRPFVRPQTGDHAIAPPCVPGPKGGGRVWFWSAGGCVHPPVPKALWGLEENGLGGR